MFKGVKWVKMLGVKKCGVCGEPYRIRGCAKRFCSRRCKHRSMRVRNAAVQMLKSARKRAAKKGRDFTVTTRDLPPIPKTCPVFGIPLFFTTGRVTGNTPSIDRINNRLGYIPGNVRVISFRANTLKSYTTDEELMMLGDDARRRAQLGSILSVPQERE
jgi:hypothetical protein